MVTFMPLETAVRYQSALKVCDVSLTFEVPHGNFQMIQPNGKYRIMHYGWPGVLHRPLRPLPTLTNNA